MGTSHLVLEMVATSVSPCHATSRILRGAEDARRVYGLSVGAEFTFWHFATCRRVRDVVVIRGKARAARTSRFGAIDQKADI
jgi:hypothetical protein